MTAPSAQGLHSPKPPLWAALWCVTHEPLTRPSLFLELTSSLGLLAPFSLHLGICFCPDVCPSLSVASCRCSGSRGSFLPCARPVCCATQAAPQCPPPCCTPSCRGGCHLALRGLSGSGCEDGGASRRSRRFPHPPLLSPKAWRPDFPGSCVHLLQRTSLGLLHSSRGRVTSPTHSRVPAPPREVGPALLASFCLHGDSASPRAFPHMAGELLVGADGHPCFPVWSRPGKWAHCPP